MTNTFRLICETKRKGINLFRRQYVISIRYSYEKIITGTQIPFAVETIKIKGLSTPFCFK